MAGYGTTARLFHWIMAIMILSTIPVGAIMVREGLTRSTQDMLFIFHKNIGVILLVLILLRLIWRLLNPPPPLPASVPRPQAQVAHLVHLGLHGMLLFMATTGFVRVSAGGFPIEMLDWMGVPPLPRNDALADTASTLHFYGKFVLVALVLMHVMGAAFHGIVKRDGVFTRMWPPLRPR